MCMITQITAFYVLVVYTTSFITKPQACTRASKFFLIKSSRSCLLALMRLDPVGSGNRYTQPALEAAPSPGSALPSPPPGHPTPPTPPGKPRCMPVIGHRSSVIASSLTPEEEPRPRPLQLPDLRGAQGPLRSPPAAPPTPHSRAPEQPGAEDPPPTSATSGAAWIKCQM